MKWNSELPSAEPEVSVEAATVDVETINASGAGEEGDNDEAVGKKKADKTKTIYMRLN